MCENLIHFSISTRTECVCAVIPFKNDSNTTSDTTSHDRQYVDTNTSI